MQQLAKVAFGMALTAATLLAYYPFVHYATRIGPFVPIPEKFDLNALPGKTVQIYVSGLGPAQMVAGDSFASVISQIRLAARVWNEVETSDLRIAFGGLFSPGTPQNTPHIEVLFDLEVPGVLATGGPVSVLEPVSGPGGTFVPIARSVLMLSRDLAQPTPRPSYGEPFFLTVVHELGHALGLQHTATSSAMSMEPTRATTRALPLANDDVAGLSSLYPAAKFLSQSGSISGQVTMSGQGVHMASVVALAPDRTPFSALTNPDGTYRIEGLPAGQYCLYVHALAPAQPGERGPEGIVLPQDPTGRSIPAGDPFETQFYPGSRDPQWAATISVAVGAPAAVNFSVQRRSPSQLYSVTTYSAPGPMWVKPAFLSTSGTQWLTAVSMGLGLTAGGAIAPGLNVWVLGGGATVRQIRAYAPAPQYLQVDFALPPSGSGPRHLVFLLNNEIYVLPSAFYVVNNQPPSISGVLPGLDSSGNRWATVTGNNLAQDTRVFFDGLPATQLNYFPGAMVVSPPPGAANYKATVTALNSDGQSSLFLQAPAAYTYDPADPPAVFLSQNALPAGAEAMVEITGVNTSFTEGQTRVGFGSSDILVRRVWVMSPARLRAQVSVSPLAAAGTSLVSAVSGFQIISQPFAFQVQPFNPRLPVINPQLLNPATGQSSVYPGSQAVVSVANLPSAAGLVSLSLYLNDTLVNASLVAPGQIGFVVPANFQPGPALLRVQYGPELIYPVVVSIDLPPPTVTSVTGGTGPIDAQRPARAGDFLIVSLIDQSAQLVRERVTVTVAGVEHPALSVAPPHQVLFTLSPSVPPGLQTLTVTVDGRTSLPFPLPVR